MAHQKKRRGDHNSLDAYAGKQLRKLRRVRGITQSALARQMGITPQQVQKYETAVNRMPAGLISRLAQCLQAHPAYFFEDQYKDWASTHITDFQLLHWIDLFQSISDKKERDRLFTKVEEMTANENSRQENKKSNNSLN